MMYLNRKNSPYIDIINFGTPLAIAKRMNSVKGCNSAITETKEGDVSLEEVTNSRHIADTTRFLLWGRSGGRCQFNGCNSPLWKNPVTQETVNVAQAAHIYAFSSSGSRGNEGVPNEELNTFSNLILACHKCHKTIDSKKDGGRYPVELLNKWKSGHEARIERVTGIDPDHHSHVILYDRAIGGMHSPVRYDRASVAMFPKRYPAEDQAIELATSASDSTERDAEFWMVEIKDLDRKFERKIGDRLANGEIHHLSIFAIAPMPLLIRLGTLLTEIRNLDVYQLHREPKGWEWPSVDKGIEFIVEKPSIANGPPALVIALSATIDDSRVQQVLGGDTAIWRVTIPEPTQECIRSKADLSSFCQALRPLLNEIKAVHGHDAILSVFPAAPVSTMVELGRIRQPKADLNWIIYDENRALGGFIKAVEIEHQDAKAATL